MAGRRCGVGEVAAGGREGRHKACPYGGGLGMREMTPGRAVRGTHKGCPYGGGLGDKGDDAGARGQGHPQGVPLRGWVGG